MKKIYIVLTHSGTLLANIIKFYTKKEYSHVSISFDEELDDMYSFGRLYTYNAFIGGFTREPRTCGTYKRFRETISSVYELEVTDKQYNKIKAYTYDLYKRRKQYKFNLIGVFAVPFNKKVTRKNAMYCAEYVKEALRRGGVDVSYLPRIITPEDFKKLKNTTLIYKGKLRKYTVKVRELEAPKQAPIQPILPRRAAV